VILQKKKKKKKRNGISYWFEKRVEREKAFATLSLSGFNLNLVL